MVGLQGRLNTSKELLERDEDNFWGHMLECVREEALVPIPCMVWSLKHRFRGEFLEY